MLVVSTRRRTREKSQPQSSGRVEAEIDETKEELDFVLIDVMIMVKTIVDDKKNKKERG